MLLSPSVESTLLRSMNVICFYSPDKRKLIAECVLRDGVYRSAVSGDTLEQVRTRIRNPWPDAVLLTIDEIWRSNEQPCEQEP